MNKIFIDGQAGTTGLQISQRLSARDDLTVLTIDPAKRKDTEARAQLMADADLTILCLPDSAAIEAVQIAPDNTRLLDASTAHRVHPEWVYGLPELDEQQRQKIIEAERVSNPGCYPQGFILLTRPLIEAGLLEPSLAMRVNAVSGYSGGGHAMIEDYQAWDAGRIEMCNTRSYSLNLKHKHVPEMQSYSGLQHTPLFTPSVGHYHQGMLVQVPLFLSELVGRTSASDVYQLLHLRYQSEPFINLLPLQATSALEGGFLNATACNDTNQLDLLVFASDKHILLAARYDNLGKGAAGSAVQNLNLMLGVEESCGLQGQR